MAFLLCIVNLQSLYFLKEGAGLGLSYNPIFFLRAGGMEFLFTIIEVVLYRK